MPLLLCYGFESGGIRNESVPNTRQHDSEPDDTKLQAWFSARDGPSKSAPERRVFHPLPHFLCSIVPKSLLYQLEPHVD